MEGGPLCRRSEKFLKLNTVIEEWCVYLKVDS